MKLAIGIFHFKENEQLLDICDHVFCRPRDKNELSQYKDKLVIVEAGTFHSGYKTVETFKNMFDFDGKLGIVLDDQTDLFTILGICDRPLYTNSEEYGIPTFPHFIEGVKLSLVKKTVGKSIKWSNEGEPGFLYICKEILLKGESREDRTKVGTFSIFSPMVISYDLSNGKVPCFTTKRVPWKSTIKELIWFIEGGTDSRDLEEQGVNWWKDNTSRDFLDNRGLVEYDVGELGPIYGFNMRSAGANYIPKLKRTENCGHGEGGVDQLQRAIDMIKNNPTSRRIIVSNYIPQELDRAVLEPCHTFIQFYVDNNGLSCTLYQRSADMFLGAQINVLSYSILTHMIAKICGIKAHRFYHHIGDAHIYKNHVTQMVEQLERPIKEPPILTISGNQNTIDDFNIGDFKIEGYSPAPGIRAPMAV